MLARSILALLFVSFYAFAEDPGAQQTPQGPADSAGSEYLHQAPGGNFELTPRLAVGGVTVNRKNTNVDENTSLLLLRLQGEYGFSDLFSLGATIGVGTGNTHFTECTATCNDTVHRGLTNSSVSGNFRIPAGLATLRFGAYFDFSMGKRKIESDGDTNLFTGGHKLTPYFGADFLLGRSRLGGLVTHDVYRSEREVERQGTAGNTTTKYSGGERTSLAAFYEYSFPRIVGLGGALELAREASGKSKSGGTWTSTKTENTTLNLRVYVPLHFNARITLVPYGLLGGTKYKDGSLNIDSVGNVEVGAYSRFVF